MMRSSVKLTAVTVIVGLTLSFGGLVLWSRHYTWDEEQARREGVFLAFALLDEVAAERRVSRLEELRPNFGLPLALARDVEGAPPPGRWIHREVSSMEEWYVLSFSDGNGVLEVGPVNPAMPPSGRTPVGALLIFIVAPLLAGVIAFRFERAQSRVERATLAFGSGELDARVDPAGPSAELATSFNTMAERIQQLIRSRDELVQAVSHELGLPLCRMRFQIELLEQAPDDHARQERIERMTSDLDALEELVAELLTFVQSGEAPLEVQAFRPADVLRDLAELAGLASHEQKSIVVDVKDTAPLKVDPRLFQRAIENLLRNAVHYARAEVRVEVSASGRDVRVAVHDDGPGIPEADREKVLAPFMRVDADRDRRSGGAGLGLAIVARVVARHGGEIAIEMSPMGGASLVTKWPRA